MLPFCPHYFIAFFFFAFIPEMVGICPRIWERSGSWLLRECSLACICNVYSVVVIAMDFQNTFERFVTYY